MKSKLCLMLLLLFLFSSFSLIAKKETEVQKQLRTIKIEKMAVEDVSVDSVIDLLRIEAKRSDPNKIGINIVTFLDAPKTKKSESRKKKEAKDKGNDKKSTTEHKRITLMLDGVNLLEAIKSICSAAELNYRVEEFAVVIFHKNFPLEPVKTKIYPFPSEAFRDIKKILREGK